MQRINQLWYLCFVNKFLKPDLLDVQILSYALKEQKDMLKETTIYFLKYKSRYPYKRELFDIIYGVCKFNYELMESSGKHINMGYFDVLKYSEDFLVNKCA